MGQVSDSNLVFYDLKVDFELNIEMQDTYKMFSFYIKNQIQSDVLNSQIIMKSLSERTNDTNESNNKWGNELGKGIGAYEIFKKCNPFSLMNYGIRAIDYYQNTKENENSKEE